MTNEELEWIASYFRQHPGEMFHCPRVAVQVAINRLSRIDPNDIQTLDDHDDAVIDHTVRYNREELLSHSAMTRPRLLVNALKSLHYVLANIGDLKVLCVGPRSESELLMLFAGGFQPDNVRGLDLISYSEFVDLGDMHAMPYADDSFDVIILGWVLGYSTDVQKVADEVIRVARPGAFVAIGCERTPPEETSEASRTGIVLDGTDFNTTDEYVALFKDHVHAVPIRHEVHRKMHDQVCHLTAVIELK